MPPEERSVPSHVYETDYYLHECDGYDTYARTGGSELPRRLVPPVELAGALCGQRILDIGCGRGELLHHFGREGVHSVGVEYSSAAMALAQKALAFDSVALAQANARFLPLADDSFDIVFALDVVEHLYQPELLQALREAYRVLASGGRLIVHTMPNLWYIRYGYPLFRLFQRLRGIRLPRDLRERWPYVPEMHVNEQSVIGLARNLRSAGFRTRVMLRSNQAWADEASPWLRRVYALLSTIYPFAWVFCSDIFAVGVKP